MKKLTLIIGILTTLSINVLANTEKNTEKNTTTKNQELEMKVSEATTNTIVITISKK